MYEEYASKLAESNRRESEKHQGAQAALDKASSDWANWVALLAQAARTLQALRSNALDHEFLTSYIERGHELVVDHRNFDAHHERCDDLDGFLRLFAARPPT